MANYLEPRGRAETSYTPDGRKRVRREWDVKAPGVEPANIVTTLGDYGAADAEHTDCRLVDRFIAKSPTNADEQIAVVVFEELPATDELQVGGDDITVDENGRRTITRRFLQFSAGTFTAGTIGSTISALSTSFALHDVQKSEPGKVRTIVRRYLEVTSDLTQVGGLTRALDADGRRTAEATFVQLASSSYVEGVIGTTAAPGLAVCVLTGETKQENSAVRTVVRRYIEATASQVQVGGNVVVNDENNRRTIEATFIQLVSGTYTLGTVGTDTAPGDTGCVLASEQKQENATVRRITKRYVQATSTLEQIGSDTIDTEVNGLRRRTQLLIGTAAASDPAGTVGTTTHGTDTTLILAGKKVERSATLTKATLVWLEPGVISKDRKKAEGGITQYTWVSVGTQQNPPGTVIAVSESNTEGYVQWTVTTLANKLDEDLVGTAGAAKLAFQYQQFVDFAMPGTVDIEEYVVPDPGNGVAGEGIKLVQTPPVTFKVQADVFVFFQESASIASGDKTYDSAVGYWNPSSWPALDSNYTPIGRSQVRQSEGFRGYRMADLSESPKTISVQTQQVALAWTNSVVFGTICNGDNGFAPVHSATLSGGPADPSGARYVLDVDIRQAFEKADGTIVYKKVIVVATITPA
jgi:hypothetical protein